MRTRNKKRANPTFNRKSAEPVNFTLGVRKMNAAEIRSALEKALSGGRTNKILRFLLGCLGGTPVVGGAIGAGAAAWSEARQSKVNGLLDHALRIVDDRIDEADKKLIEIDQKQWVAAYIKFNPNSAQFVDSSNVSSLTDNGHLDFTINFSAALKSKFTLQYFGSGEVRLEGVLESPHSVRVRFLEPCPDIVTFVFFNLE